MPETTSLARQLAEKKSKDLEKIADDIANKIRELAKLCYRDSAIILQFGSDEGILGFFTKSTIQMIPPKDLRKKLKKMEKQANAKEETDDENDENRDSVKKEEIKLSKKEALLLEIIDMFNDIETTIPETAIKSKEQAVVLQELESELQRDNFEVNITEKGLEVIWWK